jgi:signal peptidase I
MKKKSLLLTILLSIFFPGLGHLYNNETKKAIIIYLYFQLLIGLVNIFRGRLTTFFLFFLILFIPIIFVVIDSVKIAQKENLKVSKLNRWYVYIILILFSFIIDLYPILPDKHDKNFHAYIQPKNIMSPTINSKDIFQVKFFSQNKEIKRGEIVLIEDSRFGKIHKYCMRIIALPGETIQIKNSKVYINGMELVEPWELTNKSNQPIVHKEFDSLVVPSNSYYILGDNRPESYDSRDFGPVSVDNIKGKVLYIYWTFSDLKDFANQDTAYFASK